MKPIETRVEERAQTFVADNVTHFPGMNAQQALVIVRLAMLAGASIALEHQAEEDQAEVKTAKNPWPSYIVYYWEHEPGINDCFGNKVQWKGKARTDKEAERKARTYAEKRKTYFRLSYVVRVTTFRDALTNQG